MMKISLFIFFNNIKAFVSFEIKCLSRKNPVKVGDYNYDFKDKACPLESKTMITLGNSFFNFCSLAFLGGESFYFFLPNLPSEKAEQKPKEGEQDIKEEISIKEEEEEEGKEDNEVKQEDDEERIKLEDDEEVFEIKKSKNEGEGIEIEDDEEEDVGEGEGEGEEEDEEGDVMEVE